jgi:predicted permease
MSAPGSFIHRVRVLARNLLHGGARDAELSADVTSYVDLLTDEKIAAGMEPRAARRSALLEFGGVEAVKEETRAVRAGALLAQVWQDTRYAIRMIRRELGFSVVAVLTLALGIGANMAIFSVVNAVLLAPLSYPDPERLVLVWERNRAIGQERDPVAPLNFQDWRTQSTAFDDVGAFRFAGFALSNVDDPEQLRALSMSSSVFRVLRARPELGRVFTEEEERRRDRVVVLAHELWQRRFAGDRTLVGRSITLNGTAFTVVGVMPSSFTFPDRNPVDIYSPLVFTREELNGRRSHTLSVIGRLNGSATIADAQTDLGAIAHRIAAEDGPSNPEVTIVGAHEVLVEDVRLGLLILLGTVGFVLLIACANVANLLLVRAASRRREIAIRAALGAGRRRLLRQLLTESVLLAGIGALAGMLVAWWLLRVLIRYGPPDLPRVDQVGIDTTVLLFVTAVAVLTGVTFGIAPALQASKPHVSAATNESSRNTTAPFRRDRGRSILLVAEIALSLMLLAGAGLMVRSLLKLQNLDLGFQPADVLTAQIFLSPTRYPIDATQFRPMPAGSTVVPDSKPAAFFAQLEERLKTTSGVESVGAVSALPLDPAGTDYDLPVIIQGKPRPRAGEEAQADFRFATVGYFRTMRIPLLRGRAFTDFDGPNGAPVVIINDTMARQMFPGGDPLGQRLILYGRPREIVGIVGSVRHRGVHSRRTPRNDSALTAVSPWQDDARRAQPHGTIRVEGCGRAGGARDRFSAAGVQATHDGGVPVRLGRAAAIYDAAAGRIRRTGAPPRTRRCLRRHVVQRGSEDAGNRCPAGVGRRSI